MNSQNQRHSKAETCVEDVANKRGERRELPITIDNLRGI